MAWNKGKGKVVTWLRANADHVGQNCLKYPFYIDPKLGYALFSVDGVFQYAHRFMCELANGPPPTDKHEAAHTCGNAHMACINPNHLEWKTRIENAQDRVRHGNYRAPAGTAKFRLGPAQIENIKALKGKVPQWELARLYGVSRQTISGIHTGALYTSEKAARVWRKRNQISPS